MKFEFLRIPNAFLSEELGRMFLLNTNRKLDDGRRAVQSDLTLSGIEKSSSMYVCMYVPVSGMVGDIAIMLVCTSSVYDANTILY